MLNTTNVSLVFIIGLIVGSFLNVCIYRLPPNKSITMPPAQYLSRRCLTVKILTGLVFVGCLAAEGLTESLPALLVFASFIVVITFVDIDHRLILNKVLLWLGCAGILFALCGSAASIAEVLWTMLCSILLGGGILLTIMFISGGEGLGGGDMKFAAVLGVWLDWKLMLLTLLLSFVMGGLISLGLFLIRVVGRNKDGIAFGPCISLAAMLSKLHGSQIIDWFFATACCFALCLPNL